MRTWGLLAFMATLFFLLVSIWALFIDDEVQTWQFSRANPMARPDYALSYNYAAMVMAYCFAIAVFSFRLIWGKTRPRRQRADVLDDL